MGRKFSYRFRLRYKLVLLAIITTVIFIACSNIIKDSQITNQTAPKPAQLNIWWEQGYNLEEDETIRNLVDNWQNQTGNQVRLSFFSNDELTAKAERAVKAGNSPDIMMNSKADRTLYPLLAWQGKLEDVSDIIEPIKNDYPDNILRSITYTNHDQGKSSYYAVPIDQITIFIFYWQNILASIGLSGKDIPQDWNSFWQFWQQAQTNLKTEQDRNIYALGLPISGINSTSDTYYLFEQILEAYDVSLFNQKGELEIETPEVRQGIIKCLKWYAQLYQQGYIPPDAVQWTNTSNNRSLLNRQSLMTLNTTFSIPATVSQDEDTYFNQLGIAKLPNKPSGKPMRHLVSIRQAAIFGDSNHKSLAKDFLRYFIQPQIAVDYLQASGNRTKPVRTSVWSDPFWQNTQDPYLTAATQVLKLEPTRLFYTVEHPAYSRVLAENIWGKALTKVAANQVEPEQATDEAIARIKEIFVEWKNN